MTVSFTRRAYAVIAGVSLGALALTGCTANGDDPDDAGVPTADVAAPEDPQVNDFGGTPADPSATGVTRVESAFGRLSADIPNSWGEFPPETAEQAQQDPAVTDVLGFWVAGVEDQHTVVILGQIQEDPPVGAQEYWDLYFAPVEDPEISIDYEISETDGGREILYIDAVTNGEAGMLEESVFFVFADAQVVVGLVSAPGEMNQDYRSLLRDVALTVEID